ncbi:MAG: hypothetical protein JXB29_01885 [Sedimentisphaerales bacterium]|nr:hypothetical protein [Sedimentisphaerales bacterium]
MIKPLIWKEWHEQRWKMAFGTVMLLFFTGSFLAARVTTQSELLIVLWFFGGLILALYSAMGVFAPEWTGRTTTFLVSKPVAGWKIFACKWLIGWLNFAVPMIVCSLCLQFVSLGWGAGNIIKGILVSLSMATMFYSMTCCFAPRKSSEAMVGFAGLIVVFGMLVHLMVINVTVIMENYQHLSFFRQMFMFINPVFWMMPISPLNSKIHEGILFIEQGLLFAVVIWIGLGKWQRRS